VSSQNHSKIMLELAAANGVSPHSIKSIVSDYDDIESIFDENHLSLSHKFELKGDTALNLLQRKFQSKAHQEYEWLENHNLSMVDLSQLSYPSLLKEIHDPPPVLFINGEIPENVQHSVAIVGSRKPTAYGSQAARMLARELASAGFCIISGLAWGIDQEAHKGALEAGGTTMAVLGSGFGNIYPRGTSKLISEISNQGCVATEFFHNVPPDKTTFPQRNRIVAGLSLATIVIEASDRSGALITARMANEQSREVMAVPGSIFSIQSKGSNRLIQQGAKLISCVDDILEELPTIERSSTSYDHNKFSVKTELTDEELRVLEVLTVDTPQHIDIIARQLDVDSATLSLSLLQMEIHGIVRQMPGMKYIKTV
jgi:DNA processing protein